MDHLRHLCNSILTKILFIVIAITLYSCVKESNNVILDDWEIEKQEIVGSLLPWPLIDDPEYTTIDKARSIADREPAIVYKGESQVYIYPTGEMTHVEIVNDRIDGIPLAITYCPITKSSIAWRRDFKTDTLHFTPSGLLFNSNLLAYDFETKSIWSQMRIEAVQGDRNKQKLQVLPLLEIPWGSIKNHFPNALIFTGKNKSSDGNSNAANLRISDKSEVSAPETGDWVFGILKGNRINIFPKEVFEEDVTILDTNSNDDLIIVGSIDYEFVVAFETTHNMTPVKKSFPVILKDDSGSHWNIFGEAVDGPRKGERLQVPIAYTALFWAWEGVFEDKTIVVN